MRSTYLFAYGTLRPGGALHDYWAPEGQPHEQATLRHARLHYAPFTTRYPVVVPADDSTVTGTLLDYRQNSVLLDRCLTMEVQAGYTPMTTVVRTERGDVEAWVCWWVEQEPGPEIPGGDWLAVAT